MPTTLIVQHTGAAFVAAITSILLVVNCSGSGKTDFTATPAGAEQGPCRAGNQCDPGLVCLSNACVNNSDAGSGGSATGNEGGSSSTAGSGTGGANNGGNPGAAGDPGTAGVPGAGGGTAGEAGSGQEGGRAGSPGVDCEGTDPNVLIDPPQRSCDPGSCYCSFGTCFPEETAAACCDRTPICGDDGGSAGVDCSGEHPIIGPPRTCEPGNCLCSEQNVIDVCLPAETAPYCCPEGIELDCVPE